MLFVYFDLNIGLSDLKIAFFKDLAVAHY